MSEGFDAEKIARDIANKIAAEAFNSPSLAYPMVERALSAAYAAGARDMREKAAKALAALRGHDLSEDIALAFAEEAILTLPIEGE